jgi:cobalt-zinc-cadmium efflux system outer membrane protein
MNAVQTLARGLAALACALPLAAPAQTAPPALGASLSGLLAYARERNPELRAMQFEADAAAARPVSAGALPDPMLEVELRNPTNEGTEAPPSLNPANVGSTKWTLAQPFAPWGQRAAKRSAAQASADEARAKAQATWAELALKLKTAYARYQQADASLVQSRELLALLDRLETAAQVRYAGGLTPQQDAIRVQVERTMLAADVLLLEGELATLRARLNGLLARAPDAPLAAPVEAPLPALAQLDAAALRERMLARNPQLQAEEARVRAAGFNRDAVYANRWPAFTPGVSAIQQNNRVAEWELRLDFNLPLQQGARRSDEREALALLDAAQARQQAALNDGTAQLGETLAQLQAARRIEVLLTTSLLPQADITLQSALAGYENGKVDFATVLEAQRQIRNTRITLIKTRAEARMKLAEIERLLGEEL